MPPTGLSAVGGNGEVTLGWNDNVEPDLDFYKVYRSTVSGGPYSFYAGGVATSTFVDGGVANGTTYYYAVTAVNASMAESEASTEAAATPQG
jgi:fibronectin type 3 domain-containing protein